MNDQQRQAFLAKASPEYEGIPLQHGLQARHREQRKNRTHSRWGRQLQRRFGSTQIWKLVSFPGRFDLEFLERALGKSNFTPPTVNDLATQTALTKKAFEARGRLRLAQKYAYKRSRTGANSLTRSERELLEPS